MMLVSTYSERSNAAMAMSNACDVSGRRVNERFTRRCSGGINCLGLDGPRFLPPRLRPAPWRAPPLAFGSEFTIN